MQKNHEIYINSLAKDIKNLFGIDLPKDKFQYSENIEKSFLKEIQTPTTLLKSIFDKVQMKDSNVNQSAFYKSDILQLEKNIFPNQNIAFNQNDFGTLKKDFENELKQIPDNSLQTLIFLLKKYAFYLPANKDLDYVSAFEHIKIRASLAQCYQLAKTENEKIPFLMLCADISGIQSFIYNIASAKAGKSLKGRSFYLQLLMDSIIQKIFTHTDINLHIGHQVYASGGKAFLLLPNTEKVRNAIDALEKEIEGKIWQEHKESLYVILSYLPFAENDLQNVGENIYKKLGDKSAEKKSQKYKNLFSKQFSNFFNVIKEDFSNPKKTTCAVTGEIIDKKKENLLNDKETDENKKVWVKANVKEQIEIADELKNIAFYVTHQGKNTISNKSKYYAFEPSDLEIFHYLKDREKDFINEYFATKSFPSLKNALIQTINNTDFLNQIKGFNASYGFTFYGGNEQPLNKENKPKNFEELAGYENENDKGKGFHKLGVLRMDVDGMGGVFATGMKDMPLSAFSTISAYLDIFFAGYLNKIRENDDFKFKDDIMILYSGGDDIFAIGKWDKIILFSAQISQQFKEFVNHREKISISGGIAIAHAKYPISKFAQDAGDAEHNAKHFNNNQKNAICFLGETVSWDKEFEFVKGMKDNFVRWIDKEKILTQGFIQKLFRFYFLQKDKNIQWRWACVYYLAKCAKDKKNASAEIHALKNFIFTGQSHEIFGEKIKDFKADTERTLILLCLAVRWTQFELR